MLPPEGAKPKQCPKFGAGALAQGSLGANPITTALRRLGLLSLIFVLLGFPRWRRLHQLSYVCAVLGVLNFLVSVKKDLTEPAVYGAVLCVLFAVRLVTWWRTRARKRSV